MQTIDLDQYEELLLKRKYYRKRYWIWSVLGFILFNSIYIPYFLGYSLFKLILCLIGWFSIDVITYKTGWLLSPYKERNNAN